MSGIQSVTNQLLKLRNEKIFSAVTGDYKGFKQASKEFSKLAIENKDVFISLKKQSSVKAPIFSKCGLNMLKIWFLEKFRIKTPEEKQLKQFVKAQKYIKNFSKEC